LEKKGGGTGRERAPAKKKVKQKRQNNRALREPVFKDAGNTGRLKGGKKKKVRGENKSKSSKNTPKRKNQGRKLLSANPGKGGDGKDERRRPKKKT